MFTQNTDNARVYATEVDKFRDFETFYIFQDDIIAADTASNLVPTGDDAKRKEDAVGSNTKKQISPALKVYDSNGSVISGLEVDLMKSTIKEKITRSINYFFIRDLQTGFHVSFGIDFSNDLEKSISYAFVTSTNVVGLLGAQVMVTNIPSSSRIRAALGISIGTPVFSIPPGAISTIPVTITGL